MKADNQELNKQIEALATAHARILKLIERTYPDVRNTISPSMLVTAGNTITAAAIEEMPPGIETDEYYTIYEQAFNQEKSRT